MLFVPAVTLFLVGFGFDVGHLFGSVTLALVAFGPVSLSVIAHVAGMMSQVDFCVEPYSAFQLQLYKNESLDKFTGSCTVLLMNDNEPSALAVNTSVKLPLTKHFHCDPEQD